MNVCRHRGSHICLESQGNIKRLTCPYHAWTYNLEGALVAAKNLSSNIDKDSLSLHRCSVDVIEGLIMINFSDNPTSLKMMKRELIMPRKSDSFDGEDKDETKIDQFQTIAAFLSCCDRSSKLFPTSRMLS